MEWAGEFTVQPLGSIGRFTLTEIRAETIAAYLQDALPFHLPAGFLNVQGEYRLAVEDRVELNITLPTVQARDVALAPLAVESDEPWVVVPQLSVADVSVDVADRSLTIGSVRVGDATVSAWRDADGSVNLNRLFLGPESVASESRQDDAAEATQLTQARVAPWTIGVKTINVERARVNLADKTIQPNAEIVLAPVNVSVSDYSSAANAALTIDSTVGFDGKGDVHVAGKLTLNPIDVDLKVAVNALDLSPAQAYVAQFTDMTLQSGALTGQASVGFQAEPASGKPKLLLASDLEVVNFATKDNALRQDFIKWQSLKLSGVNFQMEPNRLRIARVQARKPYGRVIIADNGTVNVSQILNPPRAATKAEQPRADAQKPPMPIRIDSIVIDDGSANFADYSVVPSFAAEMGALKGAVTGLSSVKDSRAKVNLNGSVDRYAPVSITGELNLLATDKYSDIAMSFRNIELTTFNPYSGKFAGYNITKGKLTTEMQYKVQNRALNATHSIVIDQLEFGDATDSKDAVSLPIKFAVALLKDRDGVIKLDLPVTGNLDDPKFRIGPIIWQVLKNTLEKIVAAPFALIGSLFGGGEELSFVDFPPGSAALTPAETEKLNKLRTGMLERPQLRLDVPLQAAVEIDRAALETAALEQAVTAAGKPNLDRLAVLTTIYTKEFAKPPVFPEATDPNVDVVPARTRLLEEELLTKLAPTAAQLDELARSRGNAIRDVLLANGEVQAERVFLTGREVTTSPTGAVRLELKLE